MNRPSHKPLVTVYITNYNYGIYIKQSIDSVLQQTFKNFELIIIDDGSTDDSKSVIEAYRHQPGVLIIYQKNKGLNVTNNIAMRAASGKYIMRLDADDFLEVNALDEMITIMENNHEIGLVFPDYFYVNESGSRTGEERRYNFDKEVSLYDQPAHGACTLIRLDYLKSLGGYNESFTCQDGYDLWIKFVTHHKVTNINKPLFSYRRHSTNLTLNEEKILNTRKQIKEVFVNQNFEKPTTLAVLPVRDHFIGNENLPLFFFNGKTLLEHKIDTCLASKHVSQIVVSVAGAELFDFANAAFKNEPTIHVIQRPQEFAGPNETLFTTLMHAVDHIGSIKFEPQAVMSVSLDFPFTQADVLDEAINTLVLFKSDTVLSVRSDTQMYYQHTGHTLQPILNQDKFTRLEREALYRGAGGIILTTVASLIKHQKTVAGIVSHIVVNQKNAFGIFSDFDLSLMRSYVNQLQGNYAF